MQSILESLEAIGPLRIAASAFAIMLVGGLWYSPLLFGKSWMRLSGIRIGDIRPGQKRLGAIVDIITAIATALLLALAAAHARGDGSMIFFGIGFVWLFVMLEQLRHIVWERQPFALFLLHTLRSLAALMAGAAVYYFWS